jgi:two-component system cell cycle response regulator
MSGPTEDIRILVVDDETACVENLTQFFESVGYRADGVTSGPEALARMRQDPPDLLVLDLWMPGMSGLEVSRALRADPRTAHVPILIVSGLANEGTRGEALAAGANDVLAKPIPPKELLARVRALLRECRHHQELDQTLARLQDLEATRPAPVSPAPAPEAAAPHVLIVDDEPFIRRFYRGLLEVAGYRVSEAGGAAEAYDLAEQGVDAVLLDIMMPEVSGLEALESLRRIAPDLPVIIVTAYQSAPNAVAALRGGAFDFIVKGMKNEMILNSVARAVERHRLTRENRRLIEEIRTRLIGSPVPTG